jgi:hypothetical protein
MPLTAPQIGSDIRYSLLEPHRTTTEPARSLFGVTRRSGALLLAFFVTLIVIAIWTTYEFGNTPTAGILGSNANFTGANLFSGNVPSTLIIVVTPTFIRHERIADMTRLSQTLMHVKNLEWIVIEDGNHTSPAVERILQRSGMNYVYFNVERDATSPHRGDPAKQRDTALTYIRNHYHNNSDAVVYFADDDNTYDVRLFNQYIRNVKTIGLWAVGLVGGALVEAPHVEGGKITKWDVLYLPHRTFAIDMAGFAVNLRLILNTNANFNHEGCNEADPEPCFLSRFNISKENMEAFGYNDNPKDILVWHTKTGSSGSAGGNYGYITE